MLFFRGIPQRPGRYALTLGNFDGVHLGHQEMLGLLAGEASRRGLSPAVLTFEPHPREYLRPNEAPARLTSLREKLELLADYGVEETFICRFDQRFASQPAEDFIDALTERLHLGWLLVGDDFRFGAGRRGDFAMLREYGGRRSFEVANLPSVTFDGQRISSTAVRDALAQGKMKLASSFLGRPYSISGRVVHGDAVGRSLGYPTANIQLKHNKPPLSGIFAVEVEGLADHPLPGVASLGVRPTVHNNGRPTLEVHLFDFQRDIYGAHVRVDFLHKLRDEKKFPDLPTLVAAIDADAAAARNYFILRSPASPASSSHG